MPVPIPVCSPAPNPSLTPALTMSLTFICCPRLNSSALGPSFTPTQSAAPPAEHVGILAQLLTCTVLLTCCPGTRASSPCAHLEHIWVGSVSCGAHVSGQRGRGLGLGGPCRGLPIAPALHILLPGDQHGLGQLAVGVHILWQAELCKSGVGSNTVGVEKVSGPQLKPKQLTPQRCCRHHLQAE